MTRAILLFGREQHRLLIFAGNDAMRNIFWVVSLMVMVHLSGCARVVVEDNRQKTQPLLTQMLCPYCEVPSLHPAPTVVVKASPVEKTDPAPQTITTLDNPDNSAPPEIVSQTPTEIPAQTPQIVSQPPPSTGVKVITLDLNAPDLGISTQSAPTPPPASTVPPQSKRDDEEDDDSDSEEIAAVETPSSSSTIQLTEADIHYAQDVHELTVRLMNMTP
ncbi:MAG: hypothetical protein RIT27_393 [Pseudomonadota bacterium]|jgi:hypothetical protein